VSREKLFAARLDSHRIKRLRDCRTVFFALLYQGFHQEHYSEKASIISDHQP
jgi:hypothetical protein